MTGFQNNRILEHDLPGFEEIELTSVSRKYLQVVLLNVTVFSVILLTLAGVGYLFIRNSVNEKVWLLLAGLLLLLLLNGVYQYAAFFQRKYAIRERDVVYHFGLFKRNIIIIPFNRVQHIALEEGWFSRILGLKSVSVFTAGAGGSDLTINGLPKEVAENFNQLILQKIDAEEEEKEVVEVMEDNSGQPEEGTELPARRGEKEDLKTHPANE